MKWPVMFWCVTAMLGVLALAVVEADGEIWEEDDREVLIRSERGAKNRGRAAQTFIRKGVQVAGLRNAEKARRGSRRRLTKPAQDNIVKEPCRYVKGAWSECETKSNTRSRTLTLKKGDQASCEQTKTIQKKCKKGSAKKSCRYEKGTWSECNAQGEMTRNDKLKANSDPSCEQNRQITKKCKAKGVKPTKGKGGRRNRQ